MHLEAEVKKLKKDLLAQVEVHAKKEEFDWAMYKRLREKYDY